MKLRIKGDSVRLRLTQSEVRAFAEHGEVHDRVRFGAGTGLTYRLRRDADITAARASWESGELTVFMPAPVADAWCGSDEVSVRAVQAIGSGDELILLVEKDFACLVPREDEDESDLFAHPDAGARC